MSDKGNPKKNRRDERRRAWQLFLQDVSYNLGNTSFRRKAVAFGKLVILLFIMIGIPVILLITMRHSLLSTEYWSNLPSRLSNHKYLSSIILVLLQAAQIIICVLPGQPIQLASSYLYGIAGGYLVSIVGAVIGCIVTYYLAQFLGSEALHVVFGEARVKDYIHKLNSRRAYMIIFLIYLIPGIPKDLTSYVAGISDIKIKPFLVVSTLGRTPGLIGSLLIGKFMRENNYTGIAITVIVVLAILFICWKNKDSLMEKLASYEDE